MKFKLTDIDFRGMMTSSNGNISALLAICAGNSPVAGEFPAQRPVTRSFDVFFDLRQIIGGVNNREAGDLRRHRTHYDVAVIATQTGLIEQRWEANNSMMLLFIFLYTNLDIRIFFQ